MASSGTSTDPPGPEDHRPREIEEAVGFGDFRFEPTSQVLFRADEPVGLPPRAAAVLHTLLRQAGEVVPKEEILDAAWPDSFVAEDSLTHAISLLRQALGDDARQPRFIQTLPRRGYRWVAVLDSGAAGARPEKELEPSVAEVRPSPWAPPALLMLGLTLLAALFWIWGWGGDPAPTAAGEIPRIERLGVMPLTAMGPEPSRFATRLAPLLRDHLEGRTGLTIVLLDGASDAEPPVDAVLLGEVVHDGSRLQVVVRVVTPEQQEPWWRQEWQLPVGAAERPEAFAASLSTRLRFLLDHTSALSTLKRPRSSEALKLTTHAADLMLGPAQQDLTLAREAVESLRRAVELDPDFARARAGWVATRAEAAGWRRLDEDELAEMKQQLDLALEDDPFDPVVHIATALHSMLIDDPQQAFAALDRAEDLAADMFWIYLVRADVELRMEAPEIARATTRRGLALDPYLLPMWGREVDVQLALGDLAAANEAVEQLEALDPDGYWAGRARVRLLWRQGQLDPAEQHLVALREQWANVPWVHLLVLEFAAATGRDALVAESEQALSVLRR